MDTQPSSVPVVLFRRTDGPRVSPAIGVLQIDVSKVEVWNPDRLNTWEYLKDSGMSKWTGVTVATYSMLSDCLNTSGCSKTHPYWDWSVMGRLIHNNVTYFLCPGDTVYWTSLGILIHPAKVD